MADLYTILKITSQATDEELKKAYKEQLLANHPDRGGSAEDFAQVKHAYEILSNPLSRSIYDEKGIEGFYQDGRLKEIPKTSFENLFGGAHDYVDSDTSDDEFIVSDTSDEEQMTASKELLVTLEEACQGTEVQVCESGVQEVDAVVPKVVVPPNTYEGTILHDQNNTPYRVRFKKHTEYTVEHKNLIVYKTIDVRNALTGATLTVQHPNGTSKQLKIEGVLDPKDNVYVLEGYGLKGGNMVFYFDIGFPSSIDDPEALRTTWGLESGEGFEPLPKKVVPTELPFGGCKQQ